MADIRNKKTEKKPYKAVPGAAWRYEDTTPVQLCKGAMIDSSVYEISENRYFTLLIKGFIVYLITAGGIGAYLTALDISFNQIIFNIIILITALICAALYHSWKSENLGYLVFFLIYATIMILFKDYINSGFYAVLNDTIDWASIYLNTEGLQYYNERISNRYVAITIAACIIGVAENVLLNNYILRRARFMIAIGISLTMSVIAFYMQKEADTIYMIMVMVGIVMTFVLKGGGHFFLSRRDHIFGKSKKGLSYLLDYKSLWQGLVTVAVFIMMVVAIMSTVFDKTFYDTLQQQSEDKEETVEIFQNFIMLGFYGLFNEYPNNGGLSTGELGGVSRITLDYQPDITVLLTPYTNRTLYIKNFSGTNYQPYTNVWDRDPNFDETSSGYGDEVRVLKKAYEEGNETSAMAYITVTNVEAQALSYQPYYSDGDRKRVFMRKSRTYTVYPRFEENKVKIDNKTVDETYLYVPEANQKVIKRFIKEAGFTKGTPMEIANQIKVYYQANIPYTIRPGATPWRRDFVNYFLEDNRKGYCAHFASAATLIFRQMGVPARYCEGYAISFSEIIDNGELVEDAKYSDYYSGYNPLGETALIRVDASDADAHAWVEIFDPDYGWMPVEVTPSSGLEEDDDDNFWERFNNIFGDGDEAAGERDAADAAKNGLSGMDQLMTYLAYVMIVLIVLAVLVFIFLKLLPDIRYHMDYKKAGLSDKLILKYSRYIRKNKKKNEALRKCANYSEVMTLMLPFSEPERFRMIDILERAGFSRNEISNEDFVFADGTLEQIFAKKK